MSEIFDYINELRKLEIEIQDENNNTLHLRSYIKSIDDGKILIEPPTRRKINYNIPDGTNIKILIHAEDGVFLGNSSVIGKKIDPIPGIWISYPLNSVHVQRREYLRAALDLNIKLDLIKDKDLKNAESSIIKIKNISGKGFCFVSEEKLKDYYDIFASFSLNDGINEIVKSRCEHVYSETKILNKRTFYTHAFAFIDIDEKSTERIIKECFKHQIEERRNKLSN